MPPIQLGQRRHRRRYYVAQLDRQHGQSSAPPVEADLWNPEPEEPPDADVRQRVEAVRSAERRLGRALSAQELDELL